MTVLLFVVGVVVLVIGLAISIALHEIGHLAPAKLFGVRVGQYMIGFGPTLWSRRVGETEYGVKALPVGGYISMAGMYPPSPKERAAVAAGERPGRAGGGFFATMVQDARAANDETLEGDDDTRVFYRLPVWKRVIIMLGGPLMNLVLAVVLFAVLFSGIGVATATTTIASVSECVIPADAGRDECAPSDPTAPAAEAGILPGDVLVSVDGTPVSTFAEASEIIQAHPSDPIPVVLTRDGEERSIRLTPVATTRAVVGDDGRAVVGEDGEPILQEVGFVGVGAQVSNVPQPIWAGPQAAVENVGAVVGIMAQLPVRVWDTAVDLFTGQERDPNGPLSVVGAGRLAGEVAATDAPVLDRIASLLALLASLNIALFVFNLIPLLPLDGGHVVVALWDGVKRWWARLRGRVARPVDATRLVPVTFVVVVLLIGMGGILILADLFNPISIL
ncbi:M50 family metallopeptidase [Microbacterium sp. RD1]|uniref:M50 family metallopeptidase n=1 Tax=Microbacterium sp. RD1 TaxID=3457313 RepID=UPI003FA54A57